MTPGDPRAAPSRRSQEDRGASEEMFSTIFHASPDAIDLTRLEDGVSLDCNQSYMRMYGYTREEVHGHSTLPGDLGLWVRQEDRDRHVAELQRLGQVFNFETLLRRKDGSTFIGLISSSLVDLQGVACNLSLTRDITAQKRMEEALRESAQRLRLALTSDDLGIWDRNLLDDQEIWDLRMYEIYGFGPEAMIPNYANWLEKVVHPGDAPRVAETIRAALAGERPYAIQFRILRPDGMVRHVASHAVVVRDADGRAVRVIGINRDRTEQEEAEAERRRLLAEVHHAEKLESLGSLAGGVAHDMNNVLTAILVMAEILRDRFQADPSAVRSLDTILHAGQRGRDLVKALTDFARKGLEEIASVDLNELLRKEVELLRRTTLRKIQVVLDLDEDLPEVQGAASELGSAIMNLSVNALDAMPEGGVLTLRSRRLRNGWVELAVVDSGQGMTPEVLAKALEPFFTTKPKGKGTGLGLSRVYGTVKAHGGTMELQSRPGQGTTVILRLPGCTAAPSAGSPGAAEERAARALRVLLVDDEQIILDTITPALRALGHDVAAVASGEAALACLEADGAFGAVILDQNMPGLTGLQTIQRLRAGRPALPVILSTGFLDPATEAALNDLPAVWILRKPYTTAELQRMLSSLAHPRPGASG